MIIIDKEKCIGCGKCIGDCFKDDIVLETTSAGNKAVPKNEACFECGHCIAVCPANAVEISNYDMSEVIDFKSAKNSIEADVFLNHLKSRRTIRKFQKKDIDKNQIDMILEAGRFSPTGGNRQDVAYYVSQKEIHTLKSMIIDELYEMGQEPQGADNKDAAYKKFWLTMHDEYVKSGRDRLFFDAPVAIAVSASSPQSAVIAAAHIETLVYSIGLGMLYSGFSTRAITHSKKIQQYLKLKEGYNVYAVLVIGYPAVQYVRSVPRKKANVVWN